MQRNKTGPRYRKRSAKLSRGQGHMPLILAFKRLRQENHQFEAAWSTQ